MRRLLIASVVLLAAGAGSFWFLTVPRPLGPEDLPDRTADPTNGEIVFYAAGCVSCHAAAGAEGEDRLRLGGGLALASPFGTFYATNVSTHETDGIGGWSRLDFVNAVMRGVAPDGRHLYPALPYLSYQRMTIEDALDLKAFMDTLPAVSGRTPDHDLPLPLRWRRGIGLWKLLFMDYAPFTPDPAAPPEIQRGAYLVNGPGHCGECHTPRNLLGGPVTELAFSGAAKLDGQGAIPNITPGPDGIGDWSINDLTAAFRTGLLPGFESFGGDMVAVQKNLAELPPEDQEAIARYLKSLPPLPQYRR